MWSTPLTLYPRVVKTSAAAVLSLSWVFRGLGIRRPMGTRIRRHLEFAQGQIASFRSTPSRPIGGVHARRPPAHPRRTTGGVIRRESLHGVGVVGVFQATDHGS